MAFCFACGGSSPLEARPTFPSLLPFGKFERCRLMAWTGGRIPGAPKKQFLPTRWHFHSIDLPLTRPLRRRLPPPVLLCAGTRVGIPLGQRAREERSPCMHATDGILRRVVSLVDVREFNFRRRSPPFLFAVFAFLLWTERAARCLLCSVWIPFGLCSKRIGLAPFARSVRAPCVSSACGQQSGFL